MLNQQLQTSAEPAAVLPWQQQIWQHWSRQLLQQQLPHAILLTGLTGLGKRSLAKALAHLLLCTNRVSSVENSAQAELKPCGSCRSCQLIQAGFHPDLHLLEPEAQGKALVIDQVRNLNAEVQKTAQQGGYKLVLIWPAEALNTNAANALLKTLEEPEPLTQFVLVSSAPAKLPATLRSRCQTLVVKPPTQLEGQAWLQQHLSDPAEAAILLQAADGCPLQALKLADPTVVAATQLLTQAVEAVLQGADPLDQVSSLKKMPLANLLTNLQNWLAESVRYLVKGRAGVRDTRQLAIYIQLAQRLGAQHLLSFEQELAQLQQQLARNPNLDLFLENLLLSFSQHLDLAKQQE